MQRATAWVVRAPTTSPGRVASALLTDRAGKVGLGKTTPTTRRQGCPGLAAAGGERDWKRGSSEHVPGPRLVPTWTVGFDFGWDLVWLGWSPTGQVPECHMTAHPASYPSFVDLARRSSVDHDPFPSQRWTLAHRLDSSSISRAAGWDSLEGYLGGKGERGQWTLGYCPRPFPSPSSSSSSCPSADLSEGITGETPQQPRSLEDWQKGR